MSATRHRITVASAVTLLASGLALSMPPMAGPVSAANPTIVVTITADTVASDGQTSLREAIIAADAASGADTIQLSSATYQLSLNCGTDENANAGGDLDVTATDALTITSPAGAHAEITPALACTDERIIDLQSTGAFTLEHVDLVGGHAPDASGSNLDGNGGGAIRSNTAPITLADVLLTNNTAGAAGRALATETHGGDGGAISTAAALTMVDVTASGNHAGAGYTAAVNTVSSNGGNGGAVFVRNTLATVTIETSLFYQNSSGTGGVSAGNWGSFAGDGGAVYVEVATLSVTGATFSENRAGDAGDSQAINGRDGGKGGAIRVIASVASITNSTFGSNTGGDGASAKQGPGMGGMGGALAFQAEPGGLLASVSSSSFLSNAGGTSGDSSDTSGTWSNAWGGHGGAIVAVGADVTLAVSGSFFAENQAGDSGDYLGTGATVYGGGGGFGGAIALWGASASLAETLFLGNSAGDGGTGSTACFGGGAGHGGGVGASDFALARPVLTVASSVFESNVTGTGPGCYGTNSGNGGGLWTSTAASPGSVTVTGSLFDDNHADGGNTVTGSGGAIHAEGSAPVTIENVTVHGNFADATGGGIYASYNGPMSVSFSTITENTTENGWPIDASLTTLRIKGSVIDADTTGTDACASTNVVSDGYNAELGGATCDALTQPTDMTNVASDALLGLDDNGGLGGMTRLPRASSDLVDAIPTSEAFCAAASDQRGVLRPVGSACDIGAVELRADEPQMFHPVDPVRLVDTRSDKPQGEISVTKKKYGGADNQLRITVTDVAGVPAFGVAAVSLNVTAHQPVGGGYLTVYPCGSLPTVSSVNYVTGQTVPNAVIAPVDPITGEICVYSSQLSNIIIDIAGYIPEGVGFEPVNPVRLADTRSDKPQGAITVTKQKYGGDGNILRLAVTDHLGLDPSDLEAVSLNVTAHQPVDGGYLTVFPCGTRPLASSVNFVTGQTVPNAVIAPVDPVTGDVCIYSSQDANIIVDISGYFATSVGFQPVDPVRLVDTRTGFAQGAITVTKQKYGGDGNQLRIKVTDIADVPASGVAAVSLNVTAHAPVLGGYFTVYPCGERPTVSSVNFVTGQIVPNAVIAPVDPDTGEICIYSSQDANIIIDIAGWFIETSLIGPPI